MGNLFLKDYWIKEELCKGKLGAFYKAIRAEDGTELCLQRIDLPPVLLESQRKEQFNSYQKAMEKVCELNHPNIIQTYKFFQEKGDFYNETELIGGCNLETLYSRGGQLKFNQGVKLFLQISNALKYAHEKGITHKNISSTSIYIDKNENGSLTEFGTYIFNSDPDRKEVASSFTPPKYISYLAPEQLKPGKVDQRADIYELGAVMYELFTGKPPFMGNDINELEQNILKEFPKAPMEINVRIPEFLNRILLKCLQKNPDDRYSTAEELQKDLKKLYEKQMKNDEPIRISHTHHIQNQVSSSVGGFFSNLNKNKQKKNTGRKTKKHHSKTDHTEPPSDNKSLIIISLLVILIIAGLFFALSGNNSGGQTGTPVEEVTPAPSQKVQTAPVTMGSLVMTTNEDEVYVQIKNINDASISPVNRIIPKAKQPTRVDIAPGTYKIVASKQNFHRFETQAQVMPGQLNEIDVLISARDPVLKITTEPPGAMVTLGNSHYGVTPLEIYDKSLGEYNLILVKKGFEKIEETVFLDGKQTKVINKKLVAEGTKEKQPTYTREQLENTRITVFVEPAGAGITLNNQSLGNAPVLKEKFKPGEFQIDITREGYTTKTEKIEIKPGVNNQFTFKMEESAPAVEIAENGELYVPESTVNIEDLLEGNPPVFDSSSGSNTERTGVNVKLDFRYNPGTIYDKLHRKPLTLTFERGEIEKTAREELGKRSGINVVNSGFEADLMVNYHFLVREEPGISSQQSNVYLQANTQVTDLRGRVVYYQDRQRIKIVIPSNVKTNTSTVGNNYIKYEYSNDTQATRAAVNYIKSRTSPVAAEIKKYKPTGKQAKNKKDDFNDFGTGRNVRIDDFGKINIQPDPETLKNLNSMDEMKLLEELLKNAR
ncbi:MAG: serine/threonine-protein kinase [Vulcanimicrobiota bacterium]